MLPNLSHTNVATLEQTWGKKDQLYTIRERFHLIQIQAPNFFQGPLIKLGQKLEGQFSSLGKTVGPYLGKSL